MICRSRLAAVVLLCTGGPAAAAGRTPAFMGLGYLPGREEYGTATAVSADGSTVVGYTGHPTSPVDIFPQAFRWTWQEGMKPLGPFPEQPDQSYASAVSRDGSVIVGCWSKRDRSSPSGWTRKAFMWTEAGGAVPVPGMSEFPVGNHASDVSADGSVIVGYAYSGRALLWSEATGLVDLGDLDGYEWSSAYAVSADGATVAGYSSAGNQPREVWRWTAQEGFRGLGDLPGGIHLSKPGTISADGSTIVGWSESANGAEAFRWTAEEGMVGLGSLPAQKFQSFARGVSADGSIVVGQTWAGAFIWDQAHGMRKLQDVLVNDYGLDLEGWTLISANDISDDGMVIVGGGRNPQGKSEPWVAVMPEPGTLALLAWTGLGLAMRRRRGKGTLTPFFSRAAR